MRFHQLNNSKTSLLFASKDQDRHQLGSGKDGTKLTSVWNWNKMMRYFLQHKVLCATMSYLLTGNIQVFNVDRPKAELSLIESSVLISKFGNQFQWSYFFVSLPMPFEVQLIFWTFFSSCFCKWTKRDSNNLAAAKIIFSRNLPAIIESRQFKSQWPIVLLRSSDWKMLSQLFSTVVWKQSLSRMFVVRKNLAILKLPLLPIK